MSAPALLAVSHGTDSVRGRSVVGALVAAIRARQADTRGGFVDVLQPGPDALLRKLPAGRPAVIVPLLLSAGYHVRVDLARAAREADRPVTVAGALGPDDGLVRLLARRVAEAGAGSRDRIVLGAAGSSDPAAVADCLEVADRLAGVLRRPVPVGFLSAARPTLAEVVEAARAPDVRVVVASYLLAPGFFAGLMDAAGADVVSAPLLDGRAVPPELVDAALARYAAASARVRVRDAGDLTRPPEGCERNVTVAQPQGNRRGRTA
ncbi:MULTISPECIES: sirohydrochlorin chelatase [Microbacterium]|uniref:sirohydrochlorin chelatase n=1 Tax=Microbacterium TaxID=33882 RepID=UPI001D173A48|nr:CbiX/SirB N-terminal domain-containing protein [Microbacterium testaceum]MCC4250686.1 cobalamin biosynthesis protein CbiX [Microbacterium testaceum]